MDARKPVNIILCGDNAYYMQLTVLMTSVMENNTSGSSIHFHIFESGFTEVAFNTIDKVAEIYDCSIEYVDVDEYMHIFSKTNSSAFKNNYISMACYYRLLIFNILQKDVDCCIYIDGDMIVNTDLSDLPDGLGDRLLGAVPESVAMENADVTLSHLKMYEEFSKYLEEPLRYPYCNAGFLVINLKKAREMGIWAELIDFYQKNPNMPYADQDIINAVICQGHSDYIWYLPASYNVFCLKDIDHSRGHRGTYFSQIETIEAYANPRIYHYAGVEKPWSNPVSAYYDVWWHYAALSPASTDLLLYLSKEYRRLVRNGTETGYVPDKRRMGFMERSKKKLLSDPRVRDRFSQYTLTHKPRKATRFHLSLHFFKKAIVLLYYNINKNHKNNDEIREYYYDSNNIKKLIDSHKVISFDVFDTLVCRSFSNPIDVFSYIEKSSGAPNFKEYRIKAEQRAREKLEKNQEVSLDEIYNCMPEAYLGLKEEEKAVEVLCTFSNDCVMDLVKYAEKQNKRIFFTSEMYLSEETICNILKKCGYGNYELLLSSAVNKSKRSGDLYRELIHRANTHSEHILHIGDNYGLDYQLPKDLGLDSIYIERNVEALLDSNPHLKLFYNQSHNLSASFLLSVLASFRGDKVGYWERFGREFVGPVVLAYSSWLIKQMRLDGKKTVLFVARDGYLLQRAIEILAPGEFDTHYIYAPRRISNICNMDFKLKFHSNEIQSNSFAESILKNYLKISEKEIDKMSILDKEEYIFRHMEEIEQVSERIRNAYSKYLDDVTNSTDYAIVDSMTTNFSTQKMIETLRPCSNICGYYWISVYNESNKEQFIGRKQRSFIESHRNGIKNWFIMEFALSSPEPPILDLDNGIPVYKEVNEFDRMRIDVFGDIAAGAIGFINKCTRVWPNVDLLSIDGNIIEHFVNCWNESPTKDDLEHFRNMKLPVDCEHENYEQMFKSWFGMKTLLE